MITRKKLENEIKDLTSLESLVVAYEEIAATRMRRIKNSVLRNREFLGGLTEVFASVKSSYKREVQKLWSEKRAKSESDKSSLIVTRGKTVAVFLSSNAGLYGDIIRRTFNEFSQYISSNDVDIVVVGRLGKRFMANLGRTYEYFDLPDGAEDPDKVVKILEFISKYEHILVFHGKFKDILNQVPTRTYVTGEDLSTKVSVQAEVVRSIFEPSLEKLIIFFETQILSALFDQTLYESSLSKFTSRMISLDTASMNIQKRLDTTLLTEIKFRHMDSSKKQSSALAGVSCWRI